MIFAALALLVAGGIMCVVAARTPVATADGMVAGKLSRRRAAAATLAAVIVEAITGGVGAVLVIWAALTGLCSDYSTQAECSAQQQQANVTAIIVLCLAVPIVFGLVGITIRGVGGVAVRGLGWLRLSGFLPLLAAASLTPVGLGVAASRAVGYSGVLGVTVFAVTLAAALAGWAALLRTASNRRGPSRGAPA